MARRKERQSFPQHIDLSPPFYTAYSLRGYANWLHNRAWETELVHLAGCLGRSPRQGGLGNTAFIFERKAYGHKAVGFFCTNERPMFLTANEAAAKLGIRKSQFLRAVKRGEIPPACINCRPRRWNDSQLDNLGGEGASVPTTNFEERIKNVLANEIR